MLFPSLVSFHAQNIIKSGKGARGSRFRDHVRGQEYRTCLTRKRRVAVIIKFTTVLTFFFKVGTKRRYLRVCLQAGNPATFFWVAYHVQKGGKVMEEEEEEEEDS